MNTGDIRLCVEPHAPNQGAEGETAQTVALSQSSKAKRKKKRKKGEYQALARSPETTSYSRRLTSKKPSDCVCDCLTTLFYMVIAVLSVCLIFGSLLVDVCMAALVYWPHGTFVKIYFMPSVIAIGLTLASYSLNSCCFFMYTDYCGCAPVFRLRCCSTRSTWPS